MLMVRRTQNLGYPGQGGRYRSSLVPWTMMLPPPVGMFGGRNACESAWYCRRFEHPQPMAVGCFVRGMVVLALRGTEIDAVPLLLLP